MIDYKEMISDVEVYGLEQSVKASKYPMIVDVNKATAEIVDRTTFNQV